MMKVELLKEGKNSLEDIYLSNGKLKHQTGKSIKLMPFRTKYKDSCMTDLKSFQGVVGECFRISKKQEFDKSFNTDKKTSFEKKIRDHILENALNKVESDNKEELKDIILNLFFEEDHGLIKFNKQVLPYMNFTNDHPQLNETSQFFYELFLEGDILNSKDLISGDNDNLFYKLIVECLPTLKTKKTSQNDLKYINLFDGIKKQFLEDFNFLASNQENFLKHIEDLFKYYYFYYLTQLSQRLNKFGDLKDVSPIYFSMDWETLSQSRMAYNYGWKTLSYSLEGLFSHANTIELLNYITIDGERLGDYVSIHEKFENLSLDNQFELMYKIKEVSTFYISHVTVFDTGASWEKCDEDLLMFFDRNKALAEDKLTKEIISLYQRVKYQFQNSTRKKPHDDYGQWLLNFCKINYTKNRGRLGSTTVLNQELLMFLTKLCVGKEDKIRLNLLWERLKQRGIIFDEVTKDEIIKLFERINLLEKKSDSGDAQYVKSII